MVLYPTADEVKQRQQQASEFAASNSAQSMASQQIQRNQQTHPHLSSDQQDLLLAALNSQAGASQKTASRTNQSGTTKRSSSDLATTMNGANGNGLFMSPHQAELENFNGDFTPDLDYLDGDGFDFENADLGGEMIGSLPGSGGELNGDFANGLELHEKRKNSDDDSVIEEGDAKRQETEDTERGGAKKPGRKPLTTEPTTKRKAQNRAAQRAFRERKEAHLKDLETKVSELTKAQEADKHENGLLKAQVERLHVELREYRKRLSLNGGSGANRSPPLSGYGNQTRSNSNPSMNGSNNFQFEFPKFGALPGSQIFGNQGLQAYANGSNPSPTKRESTTSPVTQSPTGNGSFSSQSQAANRNSQSRQNSMGRSMSPQSITGMNTASPSQIGNLDQSFPSYSTSNNMHGFADTLPQMNGTSNDNFEDLFSPSILKSASIDSSGNYFGANQTNTASNSNSLNEVNGGESTAGLNRVFQFNSNSSTSDSASPSASSASQWNANANSSSCGTSPEPSHDSPASKDKATESFGDKTNQMQNFSNATPTNLSSFDSFNQFGTTDYNLPSVNSFDPVLFGDYRDSHEAIIGGGDFTGGFFDDALNPAPFDYSSPSNLFGILQSPQQTNTSLNANSGVVNAPTPSKNLMAEIDKTKDGGDDDFGLPGAQKTNNKLISCNNIWSQLQSNPDFQEGKFDLDNLCSELRAKARCSESGVMVDQDHVDQALRKLGKADEQGKSNSGSHNLMFEQESWDNVLKKLGNNKA